MIGEQPVVSAQNSFTKCIDETYRPPVSMYRPRRPGVRGPCLGPAPSGRPARPLEWRRLPRLQPRRKGVAFRQPGRYGVVWNVADGSQRAAHQVQQFAVSAFVLSTATHWSRGAWPGRSGFGACPKAGEEACRGRPTVIGAELCERYKHAVDGVIGRPVIRPIRCREGGRR
jgi:hypothetical protein